MREFPKCEICGSHQVKVAKPQGIGRPVLYFCSPAHRNQWVKERTVLAQPSAVTVKKVTIASKDASGNTKIESRTEIEAAQYSKKEENE